MLNSCHSPPHSTPEGTGYLDLILKEAFRRAGLELTIQRMPAERSLQDSNDGLADGEIGRIRNMEQMYTNLVLVDEPLIEPLDFVGFTRRKNLKITTWQDLSPYNIGLLRGWKILEKNTYGMKSVIPVETPQALFSMLADNRIDIALYAHIDGLYVARELGLDDIQVIAPPLARQNMYLYMHKKHSDVIARLEKELRGMKQDNSFDMIKNDALLKLLEN